MPRFDARKFAAVVAAAEWLAARQHVPEHRLEDLAAALPPRRRRGDRADCAAEVVERLKLVVTHAGGRAWVRRTSATWAATQRVREEARHRAEVRRAAQARYAARVARGGALRGPKSRQAPP